MVSDLAVIIFIITVVTLFVFFVWSFVEHKKRFLLHNLFLMFSVAYLLWIIPLIIMRFVPTENRQLMFVLDCLMQPGGALCSPLYLCIAISFARGRDYAPKWLRLLFVLPLVTILIAWTNPLHHLYYENFSVVRSEIVFGPYMIVSGLSNYIFLISASVFLIYYGLKNNTALYWTQCILFSISGLCPLAVSFYATFSGKEVPITATPLSFIVTILLNAIAIFQFNMLDVSPVATQQILNAISDSYIVLTDTGLVVRYNKNFEQLFTKNYGIIEGKRLLDCVKPEDVSQRGPIYNMLSAIESSRQGNTHISYEQTVTVMSGGVARMKYFVVEVSPLENNGRKLGFVALFKDVTQIRESMKKLQDNQERMMEQERFAFLGQMIGGLAHNLKTPIMSISGCISASEALIDECVDSIYDPDVTREDFLEIYGELRDWFSKVKESTAYMSDIITAIKGQAANISTDEKITFTIDEMLKRSMLLMRHELLNSGCRLKIDYDQSEEISLQGDINNLVQVIGNLLSNSIFAQKQMGGGEIEIKIEYDEENLKIQIMDRGTGISDNVLQKLFKSMVTSKGTMGTGLGLYISNAVIRGKFNGEMWGENREGGGSIFGISIPMEFVHVRKNVVRAEGGSR